MKAICRFLYLFILPGFYFSATAQNVKPAENSFYSIIPKPLHTTVLKGRFVINASTNIVAENGNADLLTIGHTLSDEIKLNTGLSLPVNTRARLKNDILLTTASAMDSLGEEGYSLSVSPDNIIIRGKQAHGIFYGVQTLLQLLPADIVAGQAVALPAGTIIDKPRFEWRGLMLDVGRYFYSVEFIKKYIDYLAMHKMNTFHWHLTEDHGWRIEIKKYPLLTEVGAWRNGTQFGPAPRMVNNNPHWGFYTQEQIKDIVAYAAKRYVTIVPEVEMPGHSLSALVSYPELSCSGGPFKMPVQWGIQKDIYCAGNEQTFTFLEGVLSEVAALFPGPVIHIGGDEAPKDRWKACPKCQARIKAEGLKDEHELQSYFIQRIEKFLQTKNKSILGWDEILEGGLAKNAAVMSWRGIEGGIAAAKQHHNVVMTPTNFLYLDYYQGEPQLEPVAIGGQLTLEKVYSYEPVPAELNAEEAKYIKGLQGNVWSEFIHSPAKVEYMTFPRAAAVAEVGWSQPEQKNWEDFKRRMEIQYVRYDKRGIQYSKSAYQVWYDISVDSTAGKATVKMKSNSYNPVMYYTLDGSEPTPSSLRYEKPFVVLTPVTISAVTFKKGKKQGQVNVRSIVYKK